MYTEREVRVGDRRFGSDKEGILWMIVVYELMELLLYGSRVSVLSVNSYCLGWILE